MTYFEVKDHDQRVGDQRHARKTDAKRQQKPKNSFTKPLKKPRRVAKSNIKRKVKSNMLTSSFWC